MSFERGSQCAEMEVAVDPAELGAGFDHPGSAPAQRHLSVKPAFDVAGVVATNFDHAFDAVGAAQGPSQGGRHPQAQHGQRFGQTLTDGGGRARIRLITTARSLGRGGRGRPPDQSGCFSLETTGKPRRHTNTPFYVISSLYSVDEARRPESCGVVLRPCDGVPL